MSAPLLFVVLATYFCCCHPSNFVLFHVYDLVVFVVAIFVVVAIPLAV